MGKDEARKEVTDWLQGSGAIGVLVVLAALVVVFVLVGAGVI
jgi:hypothetical protein